MMSSRLLILLFAVATIFLFTTACRSGGLDPEQAAREATVRASYRQAMADEPEFYQFSCAALGGLTNQKAAESWVLRFTGGAPVDRDLREERRLMQIMREDCEFAFGD